MEGRGLSGRGGERRRRRGWREGHGDQAISERASGVARRGAGRGGRASESSERGSTYRTARWGYVRGVGGRWALVWRRGRRHRGGEGHVGAAANPANNEVEVYYVTREAKAGQPASGTTGDSFDARAALLSSPLHSTGGFLCFVTERRRPRGAGPNFKRKKMLCCLRAGGRCRWDTLLSLVRLGLSDRRGPCATGTPRRRPADWVRLGWWAAACHCGLLLPSVACFPQSTTFFLSGGRSTLLMIDDKKKGTKKLPMGSNCSRSHTCRLTSRDKGQSI